jgi:hypothetical protein
MVGIGYMGGVGGAHTTHISVPFHHAGLFHALLKVLSNRGALKG